MAKKKKTRQQKILSDKRREVLATSLYSYTPEGPKQQAKHAISPVRQTATITTSSYKYLAGDLTKTASLTGIVVLIELIANYFL
jgi:hypothetical protein